MAIVNGVSTFRGTRRPRKEGEQAPALSLAETAGTFVEPTREEKIAQAQVPGAPETVRASDLGIPFDPTRRGGSGLAGPAGSPTELTPLTAETLEETTEIINRNAQKRAEQDEAVPTAEPVEVEEPQGTTVVNTEPLSFKDRAEAVKKEAETKRKEILSEPARLNKVGDIRQIEAQEKAELDAIAFEEKAEADEQDKLGDDFDREKLEQKIEGTRAIADREGISLNAAERKWNKLQKSKANLDPETQAAFDAITEQITQEGFDPEDSFDLAITELEKDGFDADDLKNANTAVASIYNQNFADEMEDNYLINTRKIAPEIIQGNRKLIDARKVGETVKAGQAGASITNSYLQSILDIDPSLVPDAINQITGSPTATDDAKKQAFAFGAGFFGDTETGFEEPEKKFKSIEVIDGQQVRVFSDGSFEPIDRDLSLTERINERGEIIQGKVPAKAPTQGETNTLVFYDRMRDATTNIEDLEDFINNQDFLDQTGFKFLPNFLQSEEGQRLKQAQRAFTEARLRKDSGAAIPPSEFENDEQTYFPQPGDTPEVLKQKEESRKVAINALRGASGNAYIDKYGETPQEVSVREFRGAQDVEPGNNSSTITQERVTEIHSMTDDEIRNLSDEEIDAYINFEETSSRPIRNNNPGNIKVGGIGDPIVGNNGLEGIIQAETANLDDRFIRTGIEVEDKPDGTPIASSAYGPAQITRGLAKGHLDQGMFNDPEMKEYVSRFIAQGDKFIAAEREGRNNDPIYGLRGKGEDYFRTPKSKELYNRMAQMMWDDSLERNGGDQNKTIADWRGKSEAQDPSYYATVRSTNSKKNS